MAPCGINRRRISVSVPKEKLEMLIHPHKHRLQRPITPKHLTPEPCATSQQQQHDGGPPGDYFSRNHGSGSIGSISSTSSKGATPTLSKPLTAHEAFLSRSISRHTQRCESGIDDAPVPGISDPVTPPPTPYTIPRVCTASGPSGKHARTSTPPTQCVNPTHLVAAAASPSREAGSNSGQVPQATATATAAPEASRKLTPVPARVTHGLVVDRTMDSWSSGWDAAFDQQKRAHALSCTPHNSSPPSDKPSPRSTAPVRSPTTPAPAAVAVAVAVAANEEQDRDSPPSTHGDKQSKKRSRRRASAAAPSTSSPHHHHHHRGLDCACAAWDLGKRVAGLACAAAVGAAREVEGKLCIGHEKAERRVCGDCGGGGGDGKEGEKRARGTRESGLRPLVLPDGELDTRALDRELRAQREEAEEDKEKEEVEERDASRERQSETPNESKVNKNVADGENVCPLDASKTSTVTNTNTVSAGAVPAQCAFDTDLDSSSLRHCLDTADMALEKRSLLRRDTATAIEEREMVGSRFYAGV